MNRLNWSSADVTIDGETLVRVGIVARQNTVRVVRRRPRHVVDRADVVDITRAGRGRGESAVVTFADGTSWTAVKSDCGCG